MRGKALLWFAKASLLEYRSQTWIKTGFLGRLGGGTATFARHRTVYKDSRTNILILTRADAGISEPISDELVSLQEVYQQHKPELCAYLVKKLGFSLSEAEDVVHSAFEKTMRMSQEQLSKIRNFRAFLYKTVHNSGIDHQRHSSVGKRYVDSALIDDKRHTDEVDPYRSMVANQDLELLAKALKKMPEKRRRLIVMNRFDGLSYAEIARRVNLSETVVRKHVSRALAECMQALRMKNSDVPK